ncbi:phage/plasmid primase, P4 family [Streptomyces sp. NPDC058739]|uniref:DNA primase family protein n=1 Tax=Streptomyces sp. NPDC058739 TaxID=3346618 RepID=UPI0036CB2997
MSIKGDGMPGAHEPQVTEVQANGQCIKFPSVCAASFAHEHRLLPSSLTDHANAHLFARIYEARFRHVAGLGWLTWDGFRWMRTGGERAAMRAIAEMALHFPDTDPRGVYSRQELAQHRDRTLSTTGMKTLLARAKAFPWLNLKPAALDGNRYTLCTPAGIVDLRTGQLRKPDRSRDLHSRVTQIAPQAMPTPRWSRFLADTFGDESKGQEMIEYLRLLLGYSITGDVSAGLLPFLYGTGRNGKSVLLDTVSAILGDYAVVAPPGFPDAWGSSGLIELHGRRLVVCSETRANSPFDQARVRLLTGADMIKAPRMAQDTFSFHPTHHVWLLGNQCPQVPAEDVAFWHRIRLLPFSRTVAADRCVDNLAFELVRDEGPGILQWLIGGAVRCLSGRYLLDGSGARSSHHDPPHCEQRQR